MKKLIVSVLSACVLCPTIACAEVFDLVCTFSNKSSVSRYDISSDKLETNLIENAKELTAEFKIELSDDRKTMKAWDAGGEATVTPVLNKALRKEEDKKNIDKSTIRITASEKATILFGIFTEVITGCNAKDGVNPALYILSWPDGYNENMLYTYVYGGTCKTIPRKE